MSIPKWVRGWIAVTGTALVLGGIAWFSKLAVVATGDRVTATGAAGAFFTLGLVLILIGSTGAGLWLTTMNDETIARVLGIVLSPVLFVASFMLLQGVVRAAVGGLGPDYVREEAIILLTAVASLVVGATLLGGVIRRPRGAAPVDLEPDGPRS